MTLEELGFKADQLAYQLEQRHAANARALAELRTEMDALRARAKEALAKGAKPAAPRAPPDDALTRTVEWRLEKFEAHVKPVAKNEAIWSEPFMVMGQEMRLEFFPQGRESTWMPGFCALFLWCPAGVHIRYQLRVGSHWRAPDVDDYPAKMGHGHSNFCFLEAEVDKATDSVVVGVHILELSVREQVAEGLVLINNGPERALAAVAAPLTHRGLDRVEWTIQNAPKRAAEIPAGCALVSPSFCLCGMSELLLEFFPNGSGQGERKEGYCGFYVRGPAGKSLLVTLFVGCVKKGPIKTTFDGNAAKGLPEFCKFEEHLEERSNDLVVGIEVSNPMLEEEAQRQVIELPRNDAL